MEILHYIQKNWFQLFIDTGFALNVIAAGTRVMGWSKISTELGKLEDALTAMVQAMLNRNQKTGGSNVDSNTK